MTAKVQSKEKDDNCTEKGALGLNSFLPPGTILSAGRWA
jgi:hypothetical protein